MEKKNMNIGIFLVHSLNECGIGGMETHQKAFMSHYVYGSRSNSVNFIYVIENKRNNIVFHDYSINSQNNTKLFYDLHELISYLLSNITFTHVFLNDGWWIESISDFKSAFPLCHIYMRSGGNDAELAPWNYGNYSYEQRRSLWMESINKLDYIIANSDFSVSRLISLGINQQRIIKVRGGVNETVCNNCRNKKEKLRHELIAKLGITQKYILIFASRFVLFKGIIPALESLNKSHFFDDCHILFVGSGQLLGTIEQWCNTYLNDNQFTFTGESSNEETIRLIAASDILVNSSINLKRDSGDGNYIHTETMGRSMMEAISVNTKIIATDVGGTNELFNENQNIGYLSPCDEGSMIKAFNKIDEILKLQANHISDYSWNSVFNSYDILFSNRSIYPQMTELTKLVPRGMNSKLVIRHSTRKSLKGAEIPDEVPLTKEGISMAVGFGKNIGIPIGDIYASNVLRCVQTVKCIIEGVDDSREHQVSLVDMHKFYTDNIQQSYKTFIYEKNGKNVAVKLSNGISLPGFYPIRDIALNQLKFIFSTGGIPSCIDIYCAHDFQLICLISALFKNIQNIEDINSNWPKNLEGVLIWGNIDDFYCVWRNDICHIVDLNF